MKVHDRSSSPGMPYHRFFRFSDTAVPYMGMIEMIIDISCRDKRIQIFMHNVDVKIPQLLGPDDIDGHGFLAEKGTKKSVEMHYIILDVKQTQRRVVCTTSKRPTSLLH